MSSQFETMLDAMRRVAAVLRDAEIPFALAGSIAVYAWGGADTDHDVDFLIRQADADRALDLLVENGFRGERPPEGWLYKAFDENGSMIDLIYRPAAGPVDDAMLARAEPVSVHAIVMPAMTPTDVLVGKLHALDEHRLDLAPPLELARSLRERIDWAEVRRQTAGSPFAAGFLTVASELGLPTESAE